MEEEESKGMEQGCDECFKATLHTCQRSKQLRMRAIVTVSGIVHGSAVASCSSSCRVALSGRLYTPQPLLLPSTARVIR